MKYLFKRFFAYNINVVYYDKKVKNKKKTFAYFANINVNNYFALKRSQIYKLYI